MSPAKSKTPSSKAKRTTPKKRTTKPVAAPRSTSPFTPDDELRALIRASADVILILNRQGRYLKIEDAGSNLLYMPAGEMLGKTLHDVLPKERADVFLGYVHHVLDTGQIVNTEYNLTIQGRVEWFSVSIAPMSDDTVIWVARAVTEKKRLATMSEGQSRVLEQIATGAPLDQILESIVRHVEAQNDGMFCSILLLDPDGKTLRHGAAPNLAESYNRAIDGLIIGPNVGSCGTAACLRQRVVVSDILTDPLWEKKYADLAQRHGLRSCWSMPIFSRDGEVLGTFASYYATVHRPPAEEIKIVEEAAKLAGIAIERHIAERSERARAADLESVRTVSLSLTSQLELSPVLDAILDSVFQLVGEANDAHIFHYDPPTDSLTFGAAIDRQGSRDGAWTTPREAGLTRTVTRTGEMIVVSNVRQSPLFEGYAEDWAGAIVGLPLKIRQRVVGVMNVAYLSPHHFTESELRVLSLLADQAAIAVENARLFEAERMAREHGEALHQVAGVIASNLNREDLLNLILTQLAQVVVFESASIMLLGNDNLLSIVASVGFRSDRQQAVALTPSAAPHLHRVIVHRQPIIINDTNQSDSWQHLPDNDYIQCWLGAPLVVKNYAIGVLNLDRDTPNSYTENDARLAVAFANHAAIAIENARLFEEARRQSRELTGLYETALVTSAVLDTKSLMMRLYVQVQQLIDPDTFLMAMYDSRRNVLEIALAIEEGEMTPDAIPFKEVSLEDAGLTGWVAKNRQTLFVKDIESEPLPVAPRHGKRPARSWLGVPLLVGKKLLGVVSLQSFKPNAFTDADRRFVEPLAGQVAMALENARLYETVEAEAKRIEKLYHLSQDLSARLDPTQLYHGIHHACMQLMPAEAFVIALYDEVRDEIEAVYLSDMGEVDAPRRVPSGKGLTSWVIEHDEPLLIHDIEQANYNDTLRFGGKEHVRSMLMVPMRLGSKVMGALSTQSYRTHAYTPEDMQVLGTLAQQAAIVIENARLFDEMKRRDQILQALTYLGERLLVPGNISQILSESLSQLGEATGASTVYVFRNRMTEHGDRVCRRVNLWSSARGSLPADSAEGAEEYSYEALGYHRWVEILETGRFIAGPVTDFMPAERDWLAAQGVRSIAIFPIMSRGQWWGILGFDDRVEYRYWSSSETEALKNAAGALGAAYARLEAETAEYEQRQLAEALQNTASALNATLNFDEVLDRILENVGRVVPHDGASIMLIDGEMVRVVRARGFAERGIEDKVLGMEIPIRSFPKIRSMLDSGSPLLIPNIHADPEWVHTPETDWIQSHAAVPILVKGKVIGFINVDSETPHFFAGRHTRRLQAFADQAAIAVQNAQLYDSLHQYADELSLLYRTSSQLLLPRGDLRAVGEYIAQLVIDHFHFGHCGVLVVDETRTQTYALTHRGSIDIDVPYLPLDGPGLTVAALNSGETVYVPDVSQDPRYVSGNPQTRSELVIPLKAVGRVIGALDLQSSQIDGFSERDRRVLQAFAEHAALALENTQLLARLELALKSAEEVSHFKSQFLANTSHELRTPLTGIIGSLSMVLDNLCDTPEEERDFIQIAYVASERLLTIINDVLDISKIEAGQMKVELQNVLLASVLDEVYAIARVSAEAKGLTLQVHLPQRPSTTVRADPDKLRQVLINLVGNAIKFTDKGSVTVATSLKNGKVAISVTDTGIGISLENQKKLFQPFVQADGSLTRRYGGTGLGLSISRQLAKLMGGTLTLSSEGEGRGTTTTLTLSTDPLPPPHE